MWILDYRRDVVADFRAIYHLGWTEAVLLPAWEFLALAQRLPNYPGVMAQRAAEEAKRERRNVRNPEAKLVNVHDAAFAGMIDFG